jgi:hypothetical protein
MLWIHKLGNKEIIRSEGDNEIILDKIEGKTEVDVRN